MRGRLPWFVASNRIKLEKEKNTYIIFKVRDGKLVIFSFVTSLMLRTTLTAHGDVTSFFLKVFSFYVILDNIDRQAVYPSLLL